MASFKTDKVNFRIVSLGYLPISGRKRRQNFLTCTKNKLVYVLTGILLWLTSFRYQLPKKHLEITDFESLFSSDHIYSKDKKVTIYECVCILQNVLIVSFPYAET